MRAGMFALALSCALLASGCNSLPGKPAPGPEVPRPDSVLSPQVLFAQNDARLRIGLVEQPGRRLDQHLAIAIHVRRHPELARQHHGAPLAVVEQDRAAIAAIVGFAARALPGAVAAPPGERHLVQDVVIVGEDLVFLDADAVGDVGHGIVPNAKGRPFGTAFLNS